MKKRFLNIVLAIILNLIYSPYIYCMDLNNKLEGFLEINKKLMTQVSKDKYTVNEDQFDGIFERLYISPSSTKLINTSVGQITNSFFDIVEAQYVTSYGTGTIIINNIDEIRVITAKHLFTRRVGRIDFKLGISCLSPDDDNINYLASYKAINLLFHNNEDIAIVDFKLTNSNLKNKNNLKSNVMELSHTPIISETPVTINHYPFGTEVQRSNSGSISHLNNDHNLPTLGGSSGAPIISNNKIVGIHRKAGVISSGEAQYQGEGLKIYLNNNYVKISNIKEDFSDFNKEWSK